MKRNLLITAFIGIISFTSCTTQGSFYSQGEDQGYVGDQGYVDIQVFYDQLSPYGQWIDYPSYGYVWIPDAGPDFSPYQTDGQWVMTEYGWTWISDYPWGWAPFHYGRWDFDNRFGWFWIPDTEWGPAWVTWRRAEGYYGWAPMGPGMRAGYYGGYGDIDRWNFVRDRDFGRQHINRYEINRRDYDRLLRNSSVINNTHVDRRRNTTYIAGPSPDEVQRVTGRRVSSLAVRDNNRPGTIVNKDQVRIYRPQVQKGTRSAAPSRVTERDQVTPGVRRNSPDNIYLPNERRNDKIDRIERQGTVQPNSNRNDRVEPTPNTNMNRRQQRLEQRKTNIPENDQNTQRSSPFGQRKRDQYRQERSQQIEQPQSQPQPQPEQTAPQSQPQQSQPDNPDGGRRR